MYDTEDEDGDEQQQFVLQYYEYSQRKAYPNEMDAGEITGRRTCLLANGEEKTQKVMNIKFVVKKKRKNTLIESREWHNDYKS